MSCPTAKVPRVFVIDDDPGARASLQWLLEGAGRQATAYVSAQAFLDDYSDGPGCVVSDFRMPGLTGLELQDALLARGWTIPMVLVTAYADVTVCRRALHRGAVDLVEKPVDNGLLLARIDEALEIDAGQRVRQARRSELARKLQSLTPRETDVLHRLAEGATIKEIAWQCGIGFQTAAKQRARVMEKLAVDGEAALVRMLLADG